ncbi:MAG: hypothetical protein IPO90_12255 [Flavobacteriales bacterium]|nr:hypothetical protein [Flavobacteriales bacterium]
MEQTIGPNGQVNSYDEPRPIVGTANCLMTGVRSTLRLGMRPATSRMTHFLPPAPQGCLALVDRCFDLVKATANA